MGSTRAININIKITGENNKEQRRGKRRSSAVLPLLQPNIVPLSWLPQDHLTSVPSVHIRRAKQAHDTLRPGAGAIIPRTTLIQEPEQLLWNFLSQGTTYDILGFEIFHNIDSLPCSFGFLNFD